MQLMEKQGKNPQLAVVFSANINVCRRKRVRKSSPHATIVAPTKDGVHEGNIEIAEVFQGHRGMLERKEVHAVICNIRHIFVIVDSRFV